MQRLRCWRTPNVASGFHIFGLGGRPGHGQAVFAEAFDVEPDGFAEFPANLGRRLAGGDAAGQVWDVAGIVASGFFDHDGVTHGHTQSGDRTNRLRKYRFGTAIHL